MLLQITGFSDTDTATLNMFFNVGNAVGMLTGGVLGDLFAKRFPRYARPFVNQLSMLIIAPLFFILYKGLPGGPLMSMLLVCCKAVMSLLCRHSFCWIP